MKKLLSYLLMIALLVIFVAACSSKEEATKDTSPSIEYLTSPIVVVANAGDKQVTLEWKMDPAADNYNIYYIEDDGTVTRPDYNKMKENGIKIVGTEVTPNIISAPSTVLGLENGKRYWFSISGTNDSGESDLCMPTSAIPRSPVPLPAPENFRANAGNAKVTLTWTPVAGADYYLLSCYWQEGTNGDQGIFIISDGSASSQVVDSTTTIDWAVYDGTSIVNERSYVFYMYAVDDNDTPSDTSDDIPSSESFFVWATPSANPPPSAPTNLFVQQEGNGFVNLWWDDVPGATSYDVYIGKAKNITKEYYWYKIVGDPGDPPVSATIVTGLENDIKYYFVVTAINNRGTTDISDDLESAESNEVSATPHE